MATLLHTVQWGRDSCRAAPRGAGWVRLPQPHEEDPETPGGCDTAPVRLGVQPVGAGWPISNTAPVRVGVQPVGGRLACLSYPLLSLQGTLGNTRGTPSSALLGQGDTALSLWLPWRLSWVQGALTSEV